MNKKHFRLLFLLLFAILLFLSFNKHSKDKANSYHGVIWADAAGYYVYQPMWFIYGNNPNAFPDNVETKTGNGFYLDFKNNKVITKYPCGVAVLQAPFFLLSHLLAEPLGFTADGFSKIYSFGLYFSGVIYCCIGLFLLSRFLSRHFSPYISVIAPFLFMLGSNLYYYSIDMPGMSHIYSFFLFCCIIYLTPVITSEINFKYYLIFFCCLFLVALTRPTNVLIGLFPLFYQIKNKEEFFARIRFLFSKKQALIFAVVLSLLVAIPQLIYWYKTTGSIITYSYGDEGFSWWKAPKLIEVWFSTNNGLFCYTPLILACLAGLIIMIRKADNRKWEGYFLAVVFLVISYLFASWWCWWFGCAFGARSFIEYYALLSIPFAYLLEYSLKHKLYRYLTIVFIASCVYLNMDMEYYYDGCFYGGTWDFATYLKLLNS